MAIINSHLYVIDEEICRRFIDSIQVCTHGQDCDVCCWPWVGSTTPKGYGQFTIPKLDCRRITGDRDRGIAVRIPAHVFAYEMRYGAIPNRQLRRIDVCHSCDNPPCCNWHHLLPGSRKQNVADAVQKGRHVHHGSHGMSILKPEDIPDIFALRAQGLLHKEIGKLKGVTRSTIGLVLNNITWKDPTR